MANPLSEASRPVIQMTARATSQGESTIRIVDETEYLMSSPTNAKRLRESIEELNTTGGTLRELLE